MSIAERSALYQEKTGSVTAEEQIDRYLDELAVAKTKLREWSIPERIALADDCFDGMMRHAREWVDAGCKAKGIPAGSPLRAEELSTGPLATARYLRLITQSLADIAKHGVPQLPGEIVTGPSGELRVQVLPTRGLFDSVAFMGFKAHVWMKPGVTRDNLRQHMATHFQGGEKGEGICCVLGAGNVSSIAPTDAFSKIFQEGRVVLLKMNPVNEYLGTIFEKAFSPLIDAGFLRIVYGGADVGSYCVQHPLVDEVHITGSIYSHDTIVWGPPGPERERRKADNDPVLKKTITSELGNVSPWIVIPGPYTDKELRFQAENFASSITNNASFNCVASKVLVHWKGWKDRAKFIGYVEDVLARTPRRVAYYPGAPERFRKFAGKDPGAGEAGTLPWVLVKDVDPEADVIYFNEESFVCVCAETALDAADERDFIQKATHFANDRLWGTLAASVMIHPKFRKEPKNEQAFQRMLADLRVGTIGVNYWSAISYAMMSTPWGGYPIGTTKDPKSGVGWVHNTYMLDAAQKAVLEGPITLFPKPLWFPSNQHGEEVIWKVLDLYQKPSLFKLPGMLLAAMKG